MNEWTIGQVAQQAKVSRDTIRLYEKEGLLKPKRRAANGYRLYTESAIDQLNFIKRAQNMGFSLQEIQQLLALRHSTDRNCEQVKQQALLKLETINAKMNELQRFQQALYQVIQDCEQRKLDSQCPIIDYLENQRSSEETQDENPS